MGLYFGWKLDRVCLYPYGGVTKFNEDINRPLYEELLILISGPLFQFLYYLLGSYFFHDPLFCYYNLMILFFNLLPIYPLDGGRILNIFLNYFFSFRFCFYLSILVSLLLCLFIIAFVLWQNIPFNFCLMFIIVLSKIIIEYRKKNFYFNRFLLERHLHNYNFPKIKIISNLKKMMRDKRHIIKINQQMYTEKEYLQRLYRRK